MLTLQYMTRQKFYSLKIDIVDAPTTDNTTRKLDVAYINSIGTGEIIPQKKMLKLNFFMQLI